MADIQIDRDELMQSMVTLRDHARKEQGRAEQAAVNESIEDERSEREQAAARMDPEKWRMAGDLVAEIFLRTVMMPNWELTDDECRALSDGVCNTLAYYFPDTSGPDHPALGLIITLGLISYQRRGIPMRKKIIDGVTINGDPDGETDGRTDDSSHRPDAIGENRARVTTMPG